MVRDLARTTPLQDTAELAEFLKRVADIGARFPFIVYAWALLPNYAHPPLPPLSARITAPWPLRLAWREVYT